MTKKIIIRHLLIIFAAGVLMANSAFAQTTGFTYQGKLTDGGTPATGTYDFEFRLFPSAGDPFPVPIETRTKTGVAVANGIFTVQLDFNDYQFDYTGRYLEIAVKPAGSQNDYTTLAPRQKITAAPYSIKASKSDSALDSVLLGGVSASSYLLKNGSGSNLTNVAKLNVSGEIVAPRLENLATDPAPASAANAGRVYFNTTTKSLMVSNGTAWTSPSSRIQTFTGELASGSFDCLNTTTAVRSAAFTKSSAASRLRITVRDTASATATGVFYLIVNFRIDGVFISSPTNFTMRFLSRFDNQLTPPGTSSSIRNSFTAVGYANGVAAGTHTLTTTYSVRVIEQGGSLDYTCNRDSDAYLIEIEEVP